MVLKIEGFVRDRLQRFQQLVLHRCQVQGAKQATTKRPLEVKLHLRGNRVVVRVVLPVTKKHDMQAIFARHLRDRHGTSPSKCKNIWEAPKKLYLFRAKEL